MQRSQPTSSGNQWLQRYLCGESSHKKTSGELRSRRPRVTIVIPFQLSHCLTLSRDSRGIRLVRFLVGYRHFSAHGKAICTNWDRKAANF